MASNVITVSNNSSSLVSGVSSNLISIIDENIIVNYDLYNSTVISNDNTSSITVQNSDVVQVTNENNVIKLGDTFNSLVVTGETISDVIVAGPSANSDKTFVHKQDIAKSIWNITHSLNKFPSVTIVDSSKREVEGSIKHINNNEVELSFSGAFSGEAFFN